MSYVLAQALQAAIYTAISTDSQIQGHVGGAVFDAAPTGALPDLYVALGDEDVADRSDRTGVGARHDFVVSVHSAEPAYGTAKAVAGRISDILIDAQLPLSRGRIDTLDFLKAKARRTDRGARRRIDLRFRARLDDQ